MAYRRSRRRIVRRRRSRRISRRRRSYGGLSL